MPASWWLAGIVITFMAAWRSLAPGRRVGRYIFSRSANRLPAFRVPGRPHLGFRSALALQASVIVGQGPVGRRVGRLVTGAWWGEAQAGATHVGTQFRRRAYLQVAGTRQCRCG